MTSLSPLPQNWESTRATLHAYALAVDAISRTHADPHPRWWHVGLKLRDDGLTTTPIALPDDGMLTVRIDLRVHDIVVDVDDEPHARYSITEGVAATAMGDRLIGAVADLGLEGEYAREKFENDDVRIYDPEAAESFFASLTAIAALFEQHRSELGSRVSPIHVWPHGFDLSFEWFGTRVQQLEEEGVVTEHPSQLNLGFYPAGRAYLYSNPWPFESDRLIDVELPYGAEWHTEGWQGTILYYDQVAGLPDAGERVLAYARAVHDATAPTLTA